MKRAKVIALGLSFGGFALLMGWSAVAAADISHGTQRGDVCTPNQPPCIQPYGSTGYPTRTRHGPLNESLNNLPQRS